MNIEGVGAGKGDALPTTSTQVDSLNKTGESGGVNASSDEYLPALSSDVLQWNESDVISWLKSIHCEE